MIDVDTENKKIFFYHSPELVKKNVKYDDKMYDFDLLSGHVCPDCGRVIDAYYVGNLPTKESSGTWQKHPYVPTLNNYCTSDPHYRFDHKYGGGYLIMCNHNETFCKTYVSTVGGITEGIKNIISSITPTPKMIPTDSMIKRFATEILENKIPGVSLIEDICKQRSTLLTVNKKEFAKNVTYEGVSEFDKEYKWKTLFYKLVIGDKDVQIIGGN